MCQVEGDKLSRDIGCRGERSDPRLLNSSDGAKLACGSNHNGNE